MAENSKPQQGFQRRKVRGHQPSKGIFILLGGLNACVWDMVAFRCVSALVQNFVKRLSAALGRGYVSLPCTCKFDLCER